MAKKTQKSKLVQYAPTEASTPPNLQDMVNRKYVVENLETGEKVIMDYFDAIQASYHIDQNSDPYYDVWESIPNPHIKIYPIEDLGPAGKLLFGIKD